jgi:meso-butanediol dehydrogenase / (S,S)-butanediol dehydrogenase / diacetyl reductase
MANRLAGKTAVVTGTGGRGIGRAIAVKFALEGANVVGCDLNVEGAEETVRLVKQAGGQMISLQPMDLREEAAVEGLMGAAEDMFGPIDILCNSAASPRLGGPLQIELKDFELTLTGCVCAPWMAIKHAVPRMTEGGAIINIASIAATGTATLDNTGVVFAYGVAKAALVHMTQRLAIELASNGIRVNCISPGVTLPASQGIVGEPGSRTHRAWLDCMLIERIGEPEDVAASALFLASEEASYITGHNLVVDGGWQASGGKGRPRPEGLELMNEVGGWFAPRPSS